MSGKLDQSLDQIMLDSGSTNKRRGRGGPRRAAQKAKAAIAAPTGGVQKTTKAAKGTGKAPAMAAPMAPRQRATSKVIISGLPEDVKEKDLKEYVNQAVGPVRSVIIAYGPTGKSRGIATLVFHNPSGPTEAVNKMNGIKIDGRSIKVEIIVDASAAPVPEPTKSLAQRTSKPKSAAKEVKAAPKAKTAAAPATNGTASKQGAKGKKGGRANRPKKKTADELDAEMQDYFGNEAAPANGAAAPAATNGAEPVDEVM